MHLEINIKPWVKPQGDPVLAWAEQSRTVHLLAMLLALSFANRERDNYRRIAFWASSCVLWRYVNSILGPWYAPLQPCVNDLSMEIICIIHANAVLSVLHYIDDLRTYGSALLAITPQGNVADLTCVLAGTYSMLAGVYCVISIHVDNATATLAVMMLTVVTPIVALALYRAVTDGTIARVLTYTRAHKFMTAFATILFAMAAVILIMIIPTVIALTGAVVRVVVPIAVLLMVCNVLNAIIPTRVRGCSCGSCVTETAKYNCRVAAAEHTAESATTNIREAYYRLSRTRSWLD